MVQRMATDRYRLIHTDILKLSSTADSFKNEKARNNTYIHTSQGMPQ